MSGESKEKQNREDYNLTFISFWLTADLRALAIGVITDCESCMQWHMDQAVQAGATQQEILETLEVAIEMGVFPATVNARFALEVMDILLGKAPLLILLITNHA